MLARLAFVAAALNDVIQVRNHAGRDKCLPMVVEIDAPRIARPLGEDLERMLRGVIAPDAGVDRARVCRPACRACRPANA